MDATQLLIDAFARVRQTAHSAVEGLDAEQLADRPQGSGNSIAWLVWHLTRVQDDHVADVAGTEQVWTAGGWAARFDLPFDVSATGYGQDGAEVAAVRVEDPGLLSDYLDAVTAATVRFLEGLTADDLDRVVDDAWDPPVTLAVRLVSVIGDDLQHAGQAAYVRGLLGG